MRSIVSPFSVCASAPGKRGGTVAGCADPTSATTLLVNIGRRIKHCASKVKQTAFFLSMSSKCGIKKELIYKTEYTPEFVTRFSGFGGWAQ